jgi:hypothetical protein
MTTSKTTLTIAALLVSMAINIFALGLVLGHHVDGGFSRGKLPPLPPPLEMLAYMEQVLPPDDARLFDTEIHRDLPPPQDNPEAAAAFQAVRETLLAPDFSPVDFQRALERAHAQRALMDKDFTVALTKAVTLISPEGRRQLAGALPDHPPSFEEERNGPPAGPPPGELPPGP